MLPIVQTDAQDCLWFQGRQQLFNPDLTPVILEAAKQLSFQQIGNPFPVILPKTDPIFFIQKSNYSHEVVLSTGLQSINGRLFFSIDIDSDGVAGCKSNSNDFLDDKVMPVRMPVDGPQRIAHRIDTIG